MVVGILRVVLVEFHFWIKESDALYRVWMYNNPKCLYPSVPHVCQVWSLFSASPRTFRPAQGQNHFCILVSAILILVAFLATAMPFHRNNKTVWQWTRMGVWCLCFGERLYSGKERVTGTIRHSGGNRYCLHIFAAKFQSGTASYCRIVCHGNNRGNAFSQQPSLQRPACFDVQMW